jgi:hypothetical protein
MIETFAGVVGTGVALALLALDVRSAGRRREDARWMNDDGRRVIPEETWRVQ